MEAKNMKLLSNIHKFTLIIIPIILLVVGYSSESIAQKLRLVIGKYDCTTNEDCSSNQFCDIDTHRCIHYTDRAECSTSPDLKDCTDCSICLTTQKCVDGGYCPECSDCSDLIKPEECPVNTITCALGQINLNNTCVECVNNSNCPSDKPLCSDNKCVSCGDKYWNNYDCISCPKNKPYWDASSLTCVECLINDNCDHVCEQSTKTCRSCVSMNYDMPYYNSSTKTCEICPEEKPIWYNHDKECKKCHDNTECEKYDINKPRCGTDGKCYPCEDGTYWNTSLKKCSECVADTNCAKRSDGKTLCDIQTGICSCPVGKTWSDTDGKCVNPCEKAMLNAGFAANTFTVGGKNGNVITYSENLFQSNATLVNLTGCDLHFTNSDVRVCEGIVAQNMVFAGNANIGIYQAVCGDVNANVLANGDIRIYWTTITGTVRSKQGMFASAGHTNGSIYYCKSIYFDRGVTHDFNTYPTYQECQ